MMSIGLCPFIWRSTPYSCKLATNLCSRSCGICGGVAYGFGGWCRLTSWSRFEVANVVKTLEAKLVLLGGGVFSLSFE
jgi:hypothetical protein